MSVAIRRTSRLHSDHKKASLPSEDDSSLEQDTISPSFSQNTSDKTSNVDKSSGLHCVGPMFEMTAVLDKVSSDTFDAIYPTNALSKGPTMCSFGLDYNDHNYALPTGLTPPSMAPHLQDYHIPIRGKYDDPEDDFPLKNELVEPVVINDDLNTSFVAEETVEDTPSVPDKFPLLRQSIQCAPNQIKRVQLKTFKDSDVLNTISAISKNVRIKDSLSSLKQEPESESSRFRNGQVFYEGFVEKLRDPERRVIEVPEHLAISAEQISDLDSDDEAVYEEPFGSTGIVNGQNLCSADFPKWFLLRCACGVRNTRQRLIQCIQCQHWQHLDCMMAMYSEIEARHKALKIHLSGTGNLLNSGSNFLEAERPSVSIVPSSYLCEICGERPVQQSIACEVQRRILEELAFEGNNCDAKPVVSIPSAPGEDPKDKKLSLLDASGSATAHIAEVAAAAAVSAMARAELQWVKKKYGDSLDVNMSIPSPPRASKRKQDLTTATAVFNKRTESRIRSELASFSSVTPVKFLANKTCEDSVAAAAVAAAPVDASVLLSPSTENLSPLAAKNTSASAIMASKKPLKRVLFGGAANSASNKNLSPLKRNFIGGINDSASAIMMANGNMKSSLFGAAWTKNYREAEHNVYSKPLAKIVCDRVMAGFEPNYGVPPSILTRTPLCRVVLFDHEDKGLEASISICINDVVMEVRGKLMLMEEYEHVCDPVTVYNRFAIMYRAIYERGIVIDCAQFGNDARFIRRSCNPNCKLDHVVVGGKLHVIIRTITEICPGTELTLPFDIDYRALHYPVECACGRSRCPVFKWSKKLMKNKVVPNMDYSKYIETQLRMLSRPLADNSWAEVQTITPAPVASAPPAVSMQRQNATRNDRDAETGAQVICKTFISTPRKRAAAATLSEMAAAAAAVEMSESSAARASEENSNGRNRPKTSIPNSSSIPSAKASKKAKVAPESAVTTPSLTTRRQQKLQGSK